MDGLSVVVFVETIGGWFISSSINDMGVDGLSVVLFEARWVDGLPVIVVVVETICGCAISSNIDDKGGWMGH